MDKEVIKLGQIGIRFVLEAAETKGAVAAFEFSVPVGAKVPMPHYHEEFDEMIYGLEGVLTFTVDGDAKEIGAGDSCFVPRGVIHGFTNTKDTDAKALAVVTPGLMGPDYFKELAALLGAAPPDPAKVKEVMIRYGLMPVMG